ncbi:unnamed protein product [Blepharisma stoltei]|uniref:Uncharacterized protein n=1 Tax=Blepharisma stoltei TaxID=1481888 RepID=A0AAU9K5E5_9CILI|nr:unnamed protein product [Blepharisma stoltei]
MDINPLEFLIEELSTDETYVKVNAIHRLQIIATILGPEKTKTELLPYLATLTHLEDEVLFALAQELGEFHPFLPGEASSLLPLLEALAALDETLIREQAVKSLIIISDILSDTEIIEIFVPTILRLASAENFSAKVSACALFSHAYPRSGELQENLRQIIFELSREDVPMVRRAALIEMGRIAKAIEKDYLFTEIVPKLRKRAEDEQDQIRALCIESLIEIIKLLNEEENKLYSLPIIHLIGEDKSWKVRFSFAKHFPTLVEVLGKDITENSLLQTFVRVLQDIESEVRAIALLSLKNTLHTIPTEKIQNLIFPILESTFRDESSTPNVKKNCTEVIFVIASYAEKDFSYAKIAPLCFDLANDENYEIKLTMIEGLGNIAKAIGPEFLTPPLCESLLRLAKESPQWRLRESVYKCCVSIAKYLGGGVFIELLQPIFFNFLSK